MNKRRIIISEYIRSFINKNNISNEMFCVIELLRSTDKDNLIIASNILTKIKGGNIIDKIHYIEEINNLNNENNRSRK